MLRELISWLLPVTLSISTPSMPVPSPQRDLAAEEKARLDAERTAIAESKAGGRRSTIVGGEVIAAEEQYGRGLLSQQKRSASTQSMGL